MSAVEKVKEYFLKIKQKWKDSDKKKKGLALGGCVASLLIVAIVIVAVQMNRHYVALFSNLSNSDLSAVVTYLSDNGVTDYRVTEDNTVEVPESQEAQLRAGILMAGYPTSGFGYGTYLDNVGNLTTETERKQLWLMEVQDRMSATIRCLDGVRDAVVNISPAEDRTYVLDSSNAVDASAHVLVTLEGTQMLSDSQVESIQAMLRTAVRGLEIENVEIVDSMGNSYSSTGTLGSIQDASQLKTLLEQEQNNLARTNILQVLAPMFGMENVAVSVRTTVDVDRKITDDTNYSMEDWAAEDGNGGRGIIGREIYDQEVIRGDRDTAGGVPGTSTNSDLNDYVNTEMNPDGTEALIQNSGENEYLYDQTKTQIEHLSGVITDMTVSVTINSDVLNGVNVPELIPHVARAVGIGTELEDEKISILSQKFYSPDMPLPSGGILELLDALPDWALYAAGGGLALFLLLLVIILSIRRRRRKRQMQEIQEERPVIAAVAAPTEGADIMEMETERSIELRQEVRKFAETSPEIAAQIVRNWLREGDDQ